MAAKAKGVGDEVVGRLKPEELAALNKTRWFDRLTSLWAPISIFGIAFSIYLVIVEFSVCAYPGLQPVLQAFGAVMLAFYFGLVAMRVVARKLIAARRDRNVLEELITETEALANQNRAQLQPRPLEELIERLTDAARALGTRDPKAVQTAAAALGEAGDRHLKKFRKGSPADFAGGFVKALLVALLIRSVLVEPFKIPSGSMIPTLEIGDQIFVNKFIYGVRVPMLEKVLFPIVREPKRGDVIVFYNRLVGKDFIKRIVATPGDKVMTQGERVWVNGNEVPVVVENEAYHYFEQSPCEPGLFEGDFYKYCVPLWFRNDWREKVATLKRENIDGTPHYLQQEYPKPAEREAVVPARSVFVMGDNRDNSMDSRFGLAAPGRDLQVEFVPYDDIKGKATVIWLSLSHGGLFDSIFGGTGIRTDRFFKSVTMCGNEPKR